MNDEIKIVYNTETSSFSDLKISVNNQGVECFYEQGYILLTLPQHLGVNLLRVSLLHDNEQFEATDIKINNVSLRAGIYLSFIEENSEKNQPATKLWKPNQTWVLPYGSPVSFWLSLVHTKIKNNQFGKNLYNKYNIYYPEPRAIPTSYPTLITDFFGNDFDFTVVDKSSATWKDIPYLPLTVSCRTDNAYNEIVSNLNYFYDNKSVPGQCKYNQIDDPEFNEEDWIVWWFIRQKTVIEDLDKFPHVKQLIDSLNIKDIWHGFLGFTKPYSYASPHVDDVNCDNLEFAEFSGCSQIYIPLNPCNDDSAFKFAGVGEIPNIPLVINNNHFVHSLYNNSDQVRIYLAIRVNPNSNSHLFRK